MLDIHEKSYSVPSYWALPVTGRCQLLGVAMGHGPWAGGGGARPGHGQESGAGPVQDRDPRPRATFLVMSWPGTAAARPGNAQ